jgi:hypothetical protein
MGLPIGALVSQQTVSLASRVAIASSPPATRGLRGGAASDARHAGIGPSLNRPVDRCGSHEIKLLLNPMVFERVHAKTRCFVNNPVTSDHLK